MKKVISILLFFSLVIVVVPLMSQAEETEKFVCDDTELLLTVRDAEGNLLGGINYQLWEQIRDADNNPVGSKKVKSGKTNTVGSVGQAEIKFKVQSSEEDEITPYALRVYQHSDKYGSFWLYDLNYSCGGSYTANLNLGTLKVKVRQVDNSLAYNQKFNVYQREFDADGNSYAGATIKKGVTTEANGEALLFLPAGYYYLDMTIDKILYKISNVLMRDQQVTDIDYSPSNTNIILRNGFGDPLDNMTVNIYSQELDVNFSKIIGDKIKTVKTNSAGEVNTNLNKDTYVFEISGDNKQKYYIWDLYVNEEISLNVNYNLSGIRVVLKDSEQNLITDKAVEIYKQENDVDGNVILGKKLSSQKTSDQGFVSVLYPAGKYVLRVPSNAKKYFYEYFDINVVEQILTDITKILPKFRVKVKTGAEESNKQSVSVYQRDYDATANQYIKGDKLLTAKTDDTRGVVDVYLPNGSYFIEYKEQIKKITTTDIFHEYTLSGSGGDNPVQPGPANPSSNKQSKLADRLKGKILLQVEGRGEAWYVHDDGRRYYLRDRESAFSMLREFGLGVSNINISKIPVGIEGRFADIDTDSDQLPDKLEEAMGTDLNDPDSDGDGYLDGVEVLSGYSPNSDSTARLQYSQDLIDRLKGKILLQVEGRGEAWYVHDDGKRYYMKNGEAAFQIMRFLSLGITNDNLNEIPAGNL